MASVIESPATLNISLPKPMRLKWRRRKMFGCPTPKPQMLVRIMAMKGRELMVTQTEVRLKKTRRMTRVTRATT